MTLLRFLNVFVLSEGGGQFDWTKGSRIHFDDATELVEIDTADFREEDGKYIFPAIARFKLAPGMLVGIGQIPTAQKEPSIARPNIFLGGKWYELRGKSQNPAGARVDIVRLSGRANEATPGWPVEQILYLFRLSNGVIFSWSE